MLAPQLLPSRVTKKPLPPLGDWDAIEEEEPRRQQEKDEEEERRQIAERNAMWMRGGRP